ncbi:MAG: OmpP1/FadL family transporter [Bacteroidales bacterium]
MKRVLNLTVAIFFVSLLSAQNANDVLRLSQNINSGTARYVSMGGAFGALGADFTSLSNNPAGLGVYRSSEFTITPSLKHRADETSYLGEIPYTDSRTRLLFDNIGIVTSFISQNEEQKGLVMLNLGVGYNRINDFNSETSAMGANPTNSIMDYFAIKAYDNHWFDITSDEDYNPFRETNAPWDAILAWNNFLIDTLQGEHSEYVAALNSGEGVYQDQSISSEGGVGEYTFSLAANLSNKFYFGATIGVQDVYYNETKYYTESALEDNEALPNGDKFENLNYNQTLTVDGSGVNFKLGAIFLPIPNLRLGLAAHTPTYYKLSENYRSSIESEFNVGTTSQSSPISLYDYKIESPYKLIGSAAYTFGSMGLISVDYEYVDYETMRFGKGDDGYKFTNENTEIEQTFTNTFNLKTGGEVWIGQLALRAGYAYYGSPYKSDVDMSSSSINVYSGGFGLKINDIFIDWAYQRYNFSDNYYLYPLRDEENPENDPIANREVLQNKFVFTLGYKF